MNDKIQIHPKKLITMLYQFSSFRLIGMLLTLLALPSIFLNAQELYTPNACNQSTKNKLREITAVLPFHKKPQTLKVEMHNGRAFLEGDIAVKHSPTPNRFMQGAVAIASTNYRWTDGVIPYIIKQGHPKTTEILKAIDYLNENTNICLTPHSGERDFVQFVRYNLGCWSYVGRQGGMQEINVGNCDFGAIVHEVCHAIGLFHEQSRSDRDKYITINWNNIDPSQHQNFEKHVYTGIDIGTYDYHSIMHYPAGAFSYTGNETISCQGRSGCPLTMGQRDQLSKGDLQAIRYLYVNAIGCGTSHQTVKPTPTPKPRSNNKRAKNELVVEVSNALGNNQYAEIIDLNIGGANTQFKLSPYKKQETIEFVFPESGWYTYSINAQTTFYKSIWGFTYKYEKKGKGTGKIYVNSNKKYQLAMKDGQTSWNSYTAYLQEMN